MLIPYSKQNISKSDINEVNKVLSSALITQGPQNIKFEKKLSKFVGSKYTVAVNSGTSALHIACLALNLSKDQRLWTSAISFVASANCAIYCGASVEFLDIDIKTGLIDINFLEKKLIKAKKINKLPSIVMPVHLAGQPCDMYEIWKLSKKYNFRIIEDASHALGAKYKKTKIGDCKFSDACVFSFHAVKTITTGEGGAVTTNLKTNYNKMLLYKNHGITREKSKLLSKKNSKFSWYYEQQVLGLNYRMTEFQAALGTNQLKQINFFYKKRKIIFDHYKDFFMQKIKNIKFLSLKNDRTSAFHLFIVIFKNKMIRNKAYNEFLKNGYNVNFHYIPIYKHPFYSRKKYPKLNNSEKYYETALSLPIFPYLKISNLNNLKKILIKYDK